MNTKRFRPKTEIIEKSNGMVSGAWVLGIDLGYSAVKLFSPTHIASFPSYAKRVNSDFSFAGNTPKEAIMYKNENNGEIWLVGSIAQNIMEVNDTSDSENSLYGRDRYTSPMFNVITDVGLGIGLFGHSDEKIVVQTGLPEKYMDDKEYLVDTISGKHNFSIKIGDGEWKTYNFNIEAENVDVMSQPKGSLFSVCINANGSFHQDASKYLNSSILVFDPGFGTLDLFPIIAGTVDKTKGETYSDLGMKRVLTETIKLLMKKISDDNPDGIGGFSLSVPAFLKRLDFGTVKYINKKKMISKEYPFETYLKEASEKVCNEAINRTMTSIDFLDYDYILVTGGTGAAWLNIIENKFKNLNTIKIIKANQNDSLPLVYSNVRGYYLFRFNKIGRAQKK